MTTVAKTHASSWTERYPELGTGPLPVAPYISPHYFALERARIFNKVWLNVGRVEQIPNVGDYFAKDLSVCKTSVMVVRGNDGIIRAFHNMCSHRGNQMVWNSRGS